MGSENDALKATMDELVALAQRVTDGTIADVDAESQLAELCTRHGPAAVRALDDYYEAHLKRIKAGDRAHL